MSLFREIIARRSLISELAVKNLKARYSRPALGFLWAFITPFLIAFVYYLVFSVFLKIKSLYVPFFLYLMSSVFPWMFFQGAVMGSLTSLIDNKNLIKESGFAQYLVPLAVVYENMLNFLPSLFVLIGASFFMLKGLPRAFIGLPFVLMLHLAITIGLSILSSLIYVRWRDIKYVMDILLLVLFYLTPVFYPIETVKGSFPPFLYKIYQCNPFVGILNLYRFTLLKGFYQNVHNQVSIPCALISPAAFAVFILILGFYAYERNKAVINDYLSY